MQYEFGYGTVVYFEDHLSSMDPFTTAETTARGDWYEVPAYPVVYIDGIRSVVGASSCEQARQAYRMEFLQRMEDTNWMSPVAIEGGFIARPDSVLMSATFRLVDPVPLGNLRATLLVYESEIEWCCGYGGEHTWNMVTRRILDQPISLVMQGDQAMFEAAVPVEDGWVPENLRAVAYLQDASTKEMIQGAMLPTEVDFSVAFTHKLRSVPDAGGVALFPGTLTNLRDDVQTLTLEPGEPFGDWTVDYLVCGDPNPRTGATQITLAPQQTCDFTVRVHTDADHEIRDGTFRITSQTTARWSVARLRTFNSSPSILLVDNDGALPGDVAVVDALQGADYLFNIYRVNDAGDNQPALASMKDYDVVIWETSRRTSGILNDAGALALQSYLDEGGTLFLTSQYYLNSIPEGGNPFTRDYLGIAAFTVDRGYHNLIGFAGDPIGNGLVLPLHFEYPSFYRGDDAVPTSSARTVLVGNEGSHAMIRNVTPSGARTVFMADAFEGISESDPDPNNTRVLLSRIVDWLATGRPLDAEQAWGVPRSSILGARPNPFNPTTEITFTVSERAAGGNVRLEIFDPAGRRIAVLMDERAKPGERTVVWTGRGDRGEEVRSGVYLARLTTLDGSATRKLVLLK